MRFSGHFGGCLGLLAVSWLFRWFAGCFCGFPPVLVGFPAVSVALRLFWSFSGCSVGGFLPLWGNCLAISVIAWPLRLFPAQFGDFWVILAPHWPFLVSSASFWPFLSILVGFWHLPSPKRHKFDVYTLTIHLLWDPGHTQAFRKIFIGFGAACCCLLVVATIWRPTSRVITINKPICTSSVTLTPIKIGY